MKNFANRRILKGKGKHTLSETLIVVIAILFGFPVFFGGLWFAIMGFVSLGGWQSLAKAYPMKSATNAQWKGLSTLHFEGFLNLGTYRNSVSVGRDEAYLHIKPLFFFKPMHPQISIPLEEITGKTTETDFLGKVRLHTEKCDVPIRVSPELARWILGK